MKFSHVIIPQENEFKKLGKKEKIGTTDYRVIEEQY